MEQTGLGRLTYTTVMPQPVGPLAEGWVLKWDLITSGYNHVPRIILLPLFLLWEYFYTDSSKNVFCFETIVYTLYLRPYSSLILQGTLLRGCPRHEGLRPGGGHGMGATFSSFPSTGVLPGVSCL